MGLEIEKTGPTFIISTFKTDIIKVGLVFSISNFFIAKTSLANNWRSFSSSYLALDTVNLQYIHSCTYNLRQMPTFQKKELERRRLVFQPYFQSGPKTQE